MIKPELLESKLWEVYSTLHDGQQNDNDKEEERDIVEHSVGFHVIAVGGFDLVSNTSSSSYSGVEMVDEALKSVDLIGTLRCELEVRYF